MPEPCLTRVAEHARRVGRKGFNAMVFPVRRSDTNAVDVPAPTLARRLARAAALVRAQSLTPLVRLEASSDGHCETAHHRWFVRAYVDALRAHRVPRPDLASPVLCGGPHSRATEIDVDAVLAERSPQRRLGTEARVPSERRGAARHLVDLTGDDARDDGPYDRRAGFVAFEGADFDTARNGDFARGWDEWDTAGPVALTSGGRPPEACPGLTATLGPGGRISQRARKPVQAFRTGSVKVRLEVVPAAGRRELRVALGPDERVVALPAGVARVDADFEAGGGSYGSSRFTIRLPRAATGPVALRSVRVLRRGPDHPFDRRWFARSTLSPAESGGEVAPTPADGLTVTPRHPVLLANALASARIATGAESFARVERRVVDERGAMHAAIMAHPGPTRPATIHWRIPTATCARRLTATMALAPECRGVGDGVDFAVHLADRVFRAHVASNEPSKPIAVDVDAADASAFAPVDVTLRTSAGSAGDATCDWALWIDPELECLESPRDRAGGSQTPTVPRTLDLSSSSTVASPATRWDEINVWKLYAYFGPGAAVQLPRDPPHWLRDRLPWVTHARVLAATGGNTCAHIRGDCGHGRESADHPFAGTCWEGSEQRAARYEILHDDAPAGTFDATTWRAGVDELLAQGLLPHLNVSAVPCALTDGHDYRRYHWNQRPVIRHDAWRRYIETLAGEIASEPSWREWRFSITNEPNCLWIDGDREAAHRVQHLGFAGSSREYAAHFVETLQVVRAVLPDARVQLGNFTIGGKFALEDNLPEYLGALSDALAEVRVSPRSFRALSFSLYETPQHGLADLRFHKLGRLRRWIGATSPFRGIPWKLDEVEVHPMVAATFEQQTHTTLDATRWAAAWHADLLAFALRERVVSVAPWLRRLFADDELERPLPKYWTYAFASLATGDVVPAAGDLLRAGGLVPRVPESARNAVVKVQTAATDPDGLGYLVTRDEKVGAWWILAWRHDATPVRDEDAASRPPLALRIVLPAATRGHAVSLSVGSSAAGERWHLDPWGVTDVRMRSVAIDAADLRIDLDAESVQLVRVADAEAIVPDGRVRPDR